MQCQLQDLHRECIRLRDFLTTAESNLHEKVLELSGLESALREAEEARLKAEEDKTLAEEAAQR